MQPNLGWLLMLLHHKRPFVSICGTWWAILSSSAVPTRPVALLLPGDALESAWMIWLRRSGKMTKMVVNS